MENDDTMEIDAIVRKTLTELKQIDRGIGSMRARTVAREELKEIGRLADEHERESRPVIKHDNPNPEDTRRDFYVQANSFPERTKQIELYEKLRKPLIRIHSLQSVLVESLTRAAIRDDRYRFALERLEKILDDKEYRADLSLKPTITLLEGLIDVSQRDRNHLNARPSSKASVTYDEAASLLRLTVRQVRRLVRSGKLKATGEGRSKRIPTEDVLRYGGLQQTKPDAEGP